MPRARRPLYVMTKPPPMVAAAIAALPDNDVGRGPDLLHVTLLSLFDLAAAPTDWLPRVVTALESFSAPAFPIVFDRIETHKATALRSGKPLDEARRCQSALVRHLLEQGAPLMLGTTPVPHLTLDYGGRGARRRAIDPLGWMVNELLLVESVVGETRHVVHARRALR